MEPATKLSDRRPLLPRLFALCFGMFLGLSLLKFGNPPIMEKWVTAPVGVYEFVFFFPWPMDWAYCLLTAVALIGLLSLRYSGRHQPSESPKGFGLRQPSGALDCSSTAESAR